MLSQEVEEDNRTSDHMIGFRVIAMRKKSMNFDKIKRSR